VVDFKYRREIDGLRAVAVSLVLLFHTDLIFTGGYVGVDVFFVISGYLITGLILKDLSENRFTMVGFWKRRILRIFPAAFAMVFVSLIVGFFVLFPEEYESLGKSSIAQQCFLSNVYFLRNTGYFDGPAESQPLLHTWSLAVEEQFYFIFPFLMPWLSKMGKQRVFPIILSLAIVSLLLSEIFVRIHAPYSFFLLPFRAWEMLLGGIVCFLPTPTQRYHRLMVILGWTALITILTVSLTFKPDIPFPGLLALAPCLASALFIYANSNSATNSGRLLSLKPVVFVGLVSYSLYLWHWPIIVFYRQVKCFPLTVWESTGLILASFLVATISWKFIEQPFRLLSNRISLRNVLLGNLAVSLVLICLSTLIYKGRGFEWRVPSESLRFAKFRKSRDFIHELTPVQIEQSQVPLNGDPNAITTALLWGDSHAMAIAPGLNLACKKHHFRLYQATHSATPPILDMVHLFKSGLNYEGPRFNASVLEFVKKKKVSLVVLSGVWEWYANHDDFEEKLRKSVLEITDSGAVVVIVLDVARQKVDPPSYVSRKSLVRMPVSYQGLPIEEYRKDNRKAETAIRAACLDLPNVYVVDPTSIFLDEKDRWRIIIDNDLMYRDPVHLSLEGGLKLEPLFSNFLSNISLVVPSGPPKD
jgi:peptidoglycan/LPS O-acetylase OafA/YrhL